MNGNRYIAKHGLGSSRGDNNFTNLVKGWVGNIPELPFLVFVWNFDVREASLVLSTVVDYSLAPVDKAILPEVLKCPVDCFDNFFV